MPKNKHSDKGRETLRLMNTVPADWRLAPIEWKDEERDVPALVTCPRCRGTGQVRRNANGEIVPPKIEHGIANEDRTLALGPCECPKGKWQGYNRTSGKVKGTVRAAVRVGSPRWAPDTRFDSRFGAGNRCGLCDKPILKSRLVPVQGRGADGRAHGMWVGADCARKFLLVMVTVDETKQFFEEPGPRPAAADPPPEVPPALAEVGRRLEARPEGTPGRAALLHLTRQHPEVIARAMPGVQTTTPRSAAALLDYLFNGIEHEPSPEAAVQQLVTWGFAPAFATELIATWERERPDLLRSGGARVLLHQQEAAERLVARLLVQHSVS